LACYAGRPGEAGSLQGIRSTHGLAPAIPTVARESVRHPPAIRGATNNPASPSPTPATSPPRHPATGTANISR